MLMSRDGTWTGSGHSSFHPNCCFTLEEGLQNAIHDSFRKEPPLKHGMVGPAGTDDPLQVVGPANIRHMGRVTNVLFEFGPCVKKQMQNVWREGNESFISCQLYLLKVLVQQRVSWSSKEMTR